MNVEDGAETTLVKTLDETDVPAVGEPGFRAVMESGENHSRVDTDVSQFL